VILQALAEYYRRADGLAPEGWEYKRIPFYVEIDGSGAFLQLTDRRAGPRPTDVPPTLVPKSEIRSGTRSYERPNALWDHYGFVLGLSKSDSEKDKATAERQLQHFTARVRQFYNALSDCGELQAILSFYQREEHKRVTSDPLWHDCYRIAGCNLTFRIAGQAEIALHADAVRRLFSSATTSCEDDPVAPKRVCLVTGETAKIAKLHFPISGVGAKPAPLCATNEAAYWSFGKEKGFGFPVSSDSNFRYTTALNHLLRRESRQRLQIGDASTVFWTQEADEIEDSFASVFSGSDDPDHTEELRALLGAIHTGKFDGGRGDNRFFVLGLAPNAARISVRFWQAAPLRDIAQRIREWFQDIRMIRGPNDPEYPSLFRLLKSCAVQNKADNVPPNLGGDIMRAILSGGLFPATWLNAAVQRCRAEQRVTYYRAAAIKAYLNRSFRHTSNREVFHAMLDMNNMNPAYRLGRLFAALEKVQEEANPGINATIRERYYGAASSTPVSVFTTLLRLKNHHIAKLENRGRATNFEKLIGEIVGGIDDFPAHLALPDQGRFAIGYYHQRQFFFTKPDSTTTTTEEK